MILWFVQSLLNHLVYRHRWSLWRVLDFLHLIMISHAFYFYTVKNYMNPVALLKITWSVVTVGSHSWCWFFIRSLVVRASLEMWNNAVTMWPICMRTGSRVLYSRSSYLCPGQFSCSTSRPPAISLWEGMFLETRVRLIWLFDSFYFRRIFAHRVWQREYPRN